MGDFLGVFVNNEIVAFVRFDTSLEIESVNSDRCIKFDSQAMFDECLELMSKTHAPLGEVLQATAKMRVFSQIEQVARVVIVDQKTDQLGPLQKDSCGTSIVTGPKTERLISLYLKKHSQI